jgi:steroid delta-isomerase-like uncharacterized protein
MALPPNSGSIANERTRIVINYGVCNFAATACIDERLPLARIDRRFVRMNSTTALLAATLLMSVTSFSASGGEREERISHNEKLARRYFEEVWNRGEVAVLDELLAPNYINHTPSTPNPAPGPDGLEPIVLAIRRAFPDLHYEIKDVIATEDSVVIRVVMTGTHRGDLFGLPPTGRRVQVDQINIERIRDGRIAEHWRVTDELQLMRQLGAPPCAETP